jgi:hypothetical protein
MDSINWSDNQLRNYVMRESYVAWPRGQLELGTLREQFLAQARLRIAPAVQAKLLARFGALTDPEGIAMVSIDLAQDLCGRDDARRWLLVSTEPWDSLIEWIAREIVKSQRSMAGKARPSDEAIKEIENATQ